MNSTQKILLSCSAVSYILILFSFLNFELWMTIIFLIIHSVALLYFAYLSYTSGHGEESEIELSIFKEQCARLNEKNVLLDQELEAAQTELQELQTTNQELKKVNEELTQMKLSSVEPAPVKPSKNYDSFLPPTTGEAETINIIQIAKDTVKEFVPFSQKAGINIQVSASSDVLLVKADLQRIRILFRNIIDNSIKYMNQAGTLVITLSTIGDDIFIVLKDNGKGLPEEETPHIFEINYQGSNRISGNGLGLTQAKAIVESYGGTIYAKSTIGKGMGIYIQIPID